MNRKTIYRMLTIGPVALLAVGFLAWSQIPSADAKGPNIPPPGSYNATAMSMQRTAEAAWGVEIGAAPYLLATANGNVAFETVANLGDLRFPHDFQSAEGAPLGVICVDGECFLWSVSRLPRTAPVSVFTDEDGNQTSEPIVLLKDPRADLGPRKSLSAQGDGVEVAAHNSNLIFSLVVSAVE